VSCEVDRAEPDPAGVASLVGGAEVRLLDPLLGGGDLRGRWGFTSARLVVEPFRFELFDLLRTTVAGHGWATFDGTQSVVDLELSVRVAHGDATREVPVTVRRTATYRVEQSSILFDETCPTTPEVRFGARFLTLTVQLAGLELVSGDAEVDQALRGATIVLEALPLP
jgi:hypothetical protein